MGSLGLPLQDTWGLGGIGLPSESTSTLEGLPSLTPTGQGWNQTGASSTNDLLSSAYQSLLNMGPNPTTGQDYADYAANSASGKKDSILGITYSRIAAFVIGVILIGGGILMFKQTQVVISTAARGAAAIA